MGSCLTRMKAEMQPPPQRPGNWEGFAPQRPMAVDRQRATPQPQGAPRPVQPYASGNGSVLERKETPSGVPGLTYDQAGRPVWRKENAAQVEHREDRW